MIDWDETKEDPAFALLASQARYAATVFDLRPIRGTLHQIPDAKRSLAGASLVYWADSYGCDHLLSRGDPFALSKDGFPISP